MSLRQNILEAWAMALGRPAVKEQFRVYSLDAKRAGARATVSENGHPGILVPLASGERFQPAWSLRPGQGGVLEAEVAVFVEGSEKVRALAVWCRDTALRDAFLAFCEALIERWIAGVAVAQALTLCHAEFRLLLAGPTKLDTSMLVGLLGELIVVAELVERSSQTVLGWGGAERERHDFRRGQVAIEVKTTLRSDIASKKVRISSLDQLQAPEGGRLFLHAIHLERTEGGKVSLPTLVERIESRLDGISLDHFRSVLGVDDGVRVDVREFSVLARRSYEVREDFPCLVPAKFSSKRPDEGVSNVQYDLDLGQAERFATTDLDAFSAYIAEPTTA